MANAQYAKHQLFSIRRQSYEPGVRRNVTSEELASDVEEFLAAGGRTEIVPGFTEIAPRPVVARVQSHRMKPQGSSLLSMPKSAEYLGITIAIFRSRLETGSGPKPAEIEIKPNGKEFLKFSVAELDRWNTEVKKP